jgi:endonuclease-8
MPEGHTVHRIANLFTELFVGQTPEASSPQGRFDAGAAMISGRNLHDATAVGKQLFLTFETDQVVRVHLGIYGSWDVSTLAGQSARAGSPQASSLGAPRVARRRIGERDSLADADEPFPPAPRGQVRLRLLTYDTVADLRGPTACEVLTLDEAAAVQARLGPDPLVDGGLRGEEEFVRRLSATKRAVGVVLMDQSVVSGIGNVYRAEILFRHGLSPFSPASSLSRETTQALWKDWTFLLREGVKTGVMMTRHDLTAAENALALRSSKHRYFVYHRHGAPCRVCGALVVLEEMAARKLYYCPSCQVS